MSIGKDFELALDDLIEARKSTYDPQIIFENDYSANLPFDAETCTVKEVRAYCDREAAATVKGCSLFEQKPSDEIKVFESFLSTCIMVAIMQNGKIDVTVNKVDLVTQISILAKSFIFKGAAKAKFIYLAVGADQITILNDVFDRDCTCMDITYDFNNAKGAASLAQPLLKKADGRLF